jgi:hypothetical protein
MTKRKNPHAVILGRQGGLVGGRKGGLIGGKSRSAKKVRAARANGKLGGRPRKGTS